MIETRAEQIYCEYKGKVTSYVSGKVSNPHDVEDLVSIVFEKVLKILDILEIFYFLLLLSYLLLFVLHYNKLLFFCILI